jgi:hypothetical protein
VGWDYIETDHAVIVVHGTMSSKGMVGRWNLRNGALDWQIEGSNQRGICCGPVVSGDGGRVAVCWAQLGELTLDILCTMSGDCTGTFPLVGCRGLPDVRFLPNDRDAVVVLWANTSKLLSVHNFVVRESSWGMEIGCDTMAVPCPTSTVLM